MSTLLAVYSILVFLLAFAVLICRIVRPEFKDLDKKENSLKLFYPIAAVLCDFFHRFERIGQNSRIKSILKGLYIKDNVDKEYYLYRVKAVAEALFVIFCCLLTGLLITFSHQGVKYVQSLIRGDYGKGSTEYVLGVEYGDIQETIAIDVDAVRHTEEEVLLIFDDSFDAVVEKILADNESSENVTGPLNLISEYGEIEISWKIDNPQVLSYNGEIVGEIDENESILVNLFATFSLDGVTEQYTIPIVVRGKEAKEAEKLIESIKEAINQSQNPYDSEVELPEDIDGTSVVFKEISENTDYIFLIFAVVAAVAIAAGSGRRLEKKLKAREDEMAADFTEIVTKLSLMYEAGLSIFKSWERIVEEHEAKGGPPRYAYREMKLTLEKIREGASEREAYSEFGKRCGIHRYIKLGNLLEQNLTKGTKGLKTLLKQEVDEAFEARTRLARKRGEEASTKMLVPMVIMLVIVIVIISVPALMSINM